MTFKKAYLAITALAFSFVVGMSAVSAEEAKTLSTDEIKKAFVGNTMDYKKAYVFWSPDGVIKGKLKSRDRSDEGKYVIKEGGLYCRKWDNWRGGKEECVTVKRTGNDYSTVKLDGSLRSNFKIMKGNPKGL